MNYWIGSVFIGIVVAFAGVLVMFFLTFALVTCLDGVWWLLRRVVGYEQCEGVLGWIFGAIAIVAFVAFGIWFLII